MMLGVEVDCKNSRGHEVLDLATNLDIISLIKAHKAALRCAETSEVKTWKDGRDRDGLKVELICFWFFFF